MLEEKKRGAGAGNELVGVERKARPGADKRFAGEKVTRAGRGKRIACSLIPCTENVSCVFFSLTRIKYNIYKRVKTEGNLTTN